MRPFMTFLMFLLLSFPMKGQIQSLAVSQGRELFLRYCKQDRWFAKQEEDRRYYEAFMHDLDHDGNLDVIYADADNHDDASNLWSGIRFVTEGDVVGSDAKGADRSINVDARADQFFLLCGKDGKLQLVVRNALIYDVVPLKMMGVEKLLRCDARLKMTADGCLLYDKLPRGIAEELFSGAAERLERAYSCFYIGSELKPKSMDPGCEFKALRKGAEFEDGMFALLKELMREGPSATNDVGKVCHVVYLDADNDGDTDCYVARGEATDVMRWRLYLNEHGTFRRAQETIWHNKARQYGFTAIEPEVQASTKSFYRAVFHDGEPTVIVVGQDEKGFYSQSERKYRGSFSEGKIMDLDYTIRHPCFHGIERLPAYTYRLKQNGDKTKRGQAP